MRFISRCMLQSCIAITCSSLVLSSMAAPKKPVVKTAKPTPTRGVKGTVQLAGDNARIGTTYTLGQGYDAINFTLVSAEYQPSRILLADTILPAKADEKFLVLHFTLHNPNNRDFVANWATLRYTAIDSKDVNHVLSGNGSVLLVKEGTFESIKISLKPAQKIAAWTAIRIPADVSIPKLIIQRGDSIPVLRIYFQKGDIKAVQPPFADPNDDKGCVAVKEIQGDSGAFYPSKTFDLKLDSTEYASKKIGVTPLRAGMKFFIATLTAKNGTMKPQRLFGFTFQTAVKTDDGERTRMLANTILKGKQDDRADMQLQPGEEYTFRILVPVPTNTNVQEFRIGEGEGYRPIVFKVKDAQ